MNNIEIKIVGDASLEKNVEQAKEIAKQIELAYNNFQKLADKELSFGDLEEIKKITLSTKEYYSTIILQEKQKQEIFKTNQLQKKEEEKKIKELEKTQKEAAKEEEKRQKELIKIQKEAAKETERQTEIQKKSLRGLGFQLSDLRKKYDNLSESERKNKQIGGALLVEIQKLDAEFKNVSYSTGRFQSNVGNYFSALQGGVGTLLQLGAAGGIIAGLGATFSGLKNNVLGWVSAFNEGNNQLERFRVIAMQNTDANEGIIGSINDLVSEYEEVGVIGDDVQLAGLQQLAIYTRQSSSLKSLLPLLNDVNVQQNGLNATQGNAVSIAEMFGKALAGNTTLLEKNGYSLTEQQKKILKTGTESQKVAALTEALSSKVGGLNKKLAETDAGKIQQAKNLIGNLDEALGSVFLPLIAKIYQVLVNITNPLIEIVSGIGQFIEKITDATSSMSGIEAATFRATQEFEKQKSEVLLLAGVISDSNTPLEQQKMAYEQLAQISPQYFGQLEAGKTTYEELNSAINNYLEALQKQLLYEASLNELQTYYQKQARINKDIFEEQLKLRAKELELTGEQQKQQLEAQQVVTISNENMLLSQTSNVKLIEKQIENSKNRIETLKEENKKVQKESEDFLKYMTSQGIVIDTKISTPGMIEDENISKEKQNELQKYKEKMALQLSEFELNVRKRTDISILQQEQLILAKKISLQDDYIQWLTTRQKKYNNEYIDAQLQQIILENNFSEQRKKIYQAELQKFQETQKEKQLSNDLLNSQLELELQKYITELKKNGKSEIEIAELTKIKTNEIEYQKLAQKLELQREYLEFLQKNEAGDQEIKQTQITINGIITEIEKLKNKIIENSKNDEIKLKNIFGFSKEQISEIKNNFSTVYNEYINYLNAKKNAEIQALSDKKNMIISEISEDEKYIESLQEKLQKEDELRKLNISNNAAYIESQIIQEEQNIEKKKGIAEKLAIEQKKKEEEQKQAQKRQIWFQFAVDQASAISSIIRYAMANPLNSFTSGLAGVAQIAAMSAILAANFFKAKAQVAQLKDGEIDIQKGSGRKDDVPALLMRGESVIKSRETKKNKNTLTAINKGLGLEKILKAISLDYGQKELQDFNIKNNSQYIMQVRKNEELERTNKILQKNNIYLQELLNMEKSRKERVGIGNNTYIEFEGLSKRIIKIEK